MIRSILILSGFRNLVFFAVFALASVPAPSLAQNGAPAKPKTGAAATAATVSSKTTPAKTATKQDPKKAAAAKPVEHPGDAAAGKPLLVATYGDWGAYAAKSGTSKTCYALAQPKDRAPNNLKRDPAYIFIADRPAENVHNEVSIIMGFDVKGGNDAAGAAGRTTAAVPDASVDVGSRKFIMVAKGSNLWLKNAAEESPMIAAMRKSGRLTVQATSLKGNVTTDDYSLTGLAQALDRVQKECH